MVFFGDIITEEEPVTLEFEEGHVFHLRQISLDTRGISKGGDGTTRLFVRVNADDEAEDDEEDSENEGSDEEEKSSSEGSEGSGSSAGRQEFLLCTLDRKTPNYPLQISFQSEDTPVFFRVEGAPIHVVGYYEKEEGYDDQEGCCDDQFCQGCNVEESEGETEDDEEAPQLIEETAAKKVAVGSKRSHESSERDGAKSAQTATASVDADSKTQSSKKQKKQRKAAEEAEPEVPIVVVSKPPSVSEAGSRKPWNVKPQNGEGILVDKPKPLGRSSGILLTEYVVGKGPVVRPGATVHITYEGMFPDGTVFDANLKRTKPFKFRQGTSQVIRGLDLALDGMRVGGSREVVVPPELG